MLPVSIKGYRLSHQQQRLWHTQSMQHISLTVTAVSIEGKLDIHRWQVALQQLVTRHAILRTQFRLLPGMSVPVQVVSDPYQVSCPLVRLGALDCAQQEACIVQATYQLCLLPRDLEQTPPLQCLLLSHSEMEYTFLLCLPTLCADAASQRNCMMEIAQLYAAVPHMQALDEPLQYADVSSWQDEMVTENGGEQATFWSGLSEQDLLFPFEERIRTTAALWQENGFHPQRVEISNGFSTLPQFQILLHRTGVSVEAFLLACWMLCVWRLTSYETVVVGVECDGRYYEELASTLGLYSRIIPVSMLFSDKLTFERLVVLVDTYLLEAKKKQLYSLPGKMQMDETPPAILPLGFAYADWPVYVKVDNVTLSLKQNTCWVEQFLLRLSVLRRGQDIRLQLQFDDSHLATNYVERIAKSLSVLMKEGLLQPGAAISTLTLVSSHEQKVLFSRYQQAHAADLAPFQSLIQLFEAQVIRYSEQIAIVYGSEQMTYQELNARANRQAHRLRQAGASPNMLIGLYTERSIAMIVGMLAILKAHGAYVPLDVQQPVSRLAFQLEDAHISLVLTHTHLVERLPAWTGQVICLDVVNASHNVSEEENLALPVGIDDLAYVIYTSGSTGNPKGVMLRQGGVFHYIRALCTLFEHQTGLHFASVSTLAADLGNTSVFCSLASGGCLHILPYEIVASGPDFATYFTEHTIDVLKIVPSHLSALLSSCAGHSLLPQRYLVLGGETLSFNLLRQLEAQSDTCQIVNHYGPTETTIGALVHKLGFLGEDSRGYHEQNNLGAKTVPIGQPLSGVDAYILDRFGHILPEGTTGELYIGGTGLAAGYWGQPELTKQRFIVHPQDAQKRLYRTGDLARCLSNGQIEFLGRTDFQVKLRGYRIELGEIEAALLLHSAVRACVVLLREDTPGDKRLVAYVVTTHALLNAEELMRFIEELLPSYMLPTVYVFLTTLPLNTNGKIDRLLLPEPEQSNLQQKAFYVAARTPLEEIMVGLWQTILRVERIGISDHFLHLGGHSLLATQLISRIRTILQIDLPLRTLFERPTVADLCEYIESLLKQDTAQRFVPPLTAVSRIADLPLSFSQQRLWLLNQLEGGNSAYNIALAFHLAGNLDRKVLCTCLSEMTARHESMRTIFREQEGIPLQIIQPSSDFSLLLIDLCLLSEPERIKVARCLAKEEAQQIFVLAHGPLLRGWLIGFAREEHVLLITMHHIISDAWSRNIFITELTTLYHALSTGQPSPLSPLPIQYADFAAWQRDWLSDEVLQPQIDYWVRRLSGAPVLALPFDYPRPALQSFVGASRTAMLPEALCKELNELSQRSGVTLFMTLLAVFQVLLARYTGMSDIVVGTPIANRTRTEIESVIGFFTNTLVIRSELLENPSFEQVLAHVRERALEAYSHQDVPFEKLVEMLQPLRDLSRSPLFQVMFQLQHISTADVKHKGFRLEIFPGESTTAKFDLTLSVVNTGKTLYCTVEYCKELFKEQTIVRLLEHWLVLLESIVSNPQQKIHALPLLTAEELQQTSTLATQMPYTECSLCTLFERQAAITPDTIALWHGDEQLTYRELEQKTNQLARYLRRQGVRADTVVGIYLSRSAEVAISVLAILKAGAAYVPLDPTYPLERLSFMVMDVLMPVLITQQGLADGLPDYATRIYLERIWSQIALEDVAPLATNVNIEQLAYVIYTSGSTGRPKGIGLSHRALTNLIYWSNSHLIVQARMLQFASLSFDVSFYEMFATWESGGTLCLVPEELRRDPDGLLPFLATAAIEKMILPVVLLQQIAEISHKYELELPLLREITATGEQLQITSPMIEFFERLPQCSFHNQYGPSESHVVTAYTVTTQVPALWPTHPPIGRPIANTQIYLLDDYLQLVPPGAVGELYIGGVSLARGYINQPALTAERFIPHPFAGEPGLRLYKTGDAARSQADGTIEFLGRLDHQVKIHGFRVELSEIEAVLQRYPAVSEVVVLASEESLEYKRLIAYIVPVDPKTCDLVDLRQYLRKQVPEYMVPSTIVLLDALPLTSNGKIDRRALPVSPLLTLEQRKSFTPPTTVAEVLIATIWLNILKISQVGIYDDFFSLGGHSLLASRVVAQLRSTFMVQLPLRSFFEAPTIDGLIEQIAVLRGGRQVVEEIAQVLKEIAELTEDEIDVQLSTQPD